MALGSFVAKVLSTYKMDIKDVEKKSKKLVGVSKRLEEERIAGIKKTNKAIEAQNERLGKLVVGVVAVGAAWKAASAAVKTWQEDARLANASAGVNIKAVQAASHGLLTEFQAMQLAAAALNNEFGAGQKEVESLAGAIAELNHEGNELDTVFNTFLKASASGGVEELQNFGVHIRDINGVLIGKGQPGFNALVAESSKLAGEFATIAGDDAAQAGVRLEDSMRDLGVAAGKLASSLMPLVDVLGMVLKGWSDILSLPSLLGDKGLTGKSLEMDRAEREVARLQSELAGSRSRSGRSATKVALGGKAQLGVSRFEETAPLRAELAAAEADLQRIIAEINADALARNSKVGFDAFWGPGGIFAPGPGSKDDGKKKGRASVSVVAGEDPDVARMREARELVAEIQAMRRQAEGVTGGLGGPLAGLGGLGGGVEDLAQAEGPQGPTMLERVFGKPEEFELYESLLENLSQGLQTGFQAWASGAQSASEAVKTALKSLAQGLAQEMFLQALKHSAAALGDLAVGNVAGAALHGKAALAYGAGAVAAGLVARSMPSGSSAGRGASGGVSAAPGAFGAPERTSAAGRPVVVVLSGDYADDPAEVAARTARALLRAERETGSDNTVRF